ncbi:MAG: hypothetical protein EA384_02415 [Spirochaetaceae bacterium]|nr:MAG: hypothetical protein EA384_02415 [Spirochaetaceae bacterium]
MNRSAGRVLLILFALMTAANAAGFSGGQGVNHTIPEHNETRRRLVGLITGPLSTVTASRPTTYRQLSGSARVRFESRDGGDHVYLLFLNEQRGRFPIVGRGNWVIRRRAQDGAFDQVKIFLADHPDFFARIFPRGPRSTMDVILAGQTVYRGVGVPFAFEQLLQRPFADIQHATGSLVDWRLFWPADAAAQYAAVETMVDRLRPALAMLPDAEDGAMDRHGNLVFIESLVLQDQEPGFNCSGFAKWVVDGIYHSYTGNYLDIQSLRTRHIGLRGHGWSDRYEQQRDPYFGLDWSRNLALAALRLDHPTASTDPTAADVGSLTFARAVPHVGFAVDELRAVLYLLARNEPGHFYIGSVNREFGSAPSLRQHVHIVVIFPYFDAAGRYQVVVMERNVESSVASLQRRYSGDAIHLVRIRASERFQPPIFGNPAFVE